MKLKKLVKTKHAQIKYNQRINLIVLVYLVPLQSWEGGYAMNFRKTRKAYVKTIGQNSGAHIVFVVVICSPLQHLIF